MSVPRRQVVFTPPADEDFIGILQYTAREWGVRQRDTYSRKLTDALQRLTHFPHLGKPRDDLRPGLRAREAGEHVIYYRVNDEAITVLRLLHHTMDPKLHFEE